MKYEGKLNEYIYKRDNWYRENESCEVNWKESYFKLSEERKQIEEEYDLKINDTLKECSKSNNNTFELKVMKTLDSYFYRKEGLFALGNYFANVRDKYKNFMLSKNCGRYVGLEAHGVILSKSIEEMELLHHNLEEKTKVVKEILCLAALIDGDSSKVYSEDKYEKVEEAINVLEDALEGVYPKQSYGLAKVYIGNKEFDYKEFINDTSDNPIVTGFSKIISPTKDVRDNILKVNNSLRDVYSINSSGLYKLIN